MQRTKPSKVSDLLSVFLRNNGLETPLAEHRLIKSWPDVAKKVMGEAAGMRIAQATTALNIQAQVLHVSLTSPALRQQLRMTVPALVEALNAEVGVNVITSIALH